MNGAETTVTSRERKMKIKLIGSPTCGPCNMIKSVMKNKNIEFEYIDITSDAGQELAVELNIRTVPTLMKGKDAVIVGAPAILATFK